MCPFAWVTDDKHEKPDRVPSSSVDPADESSDSDEAGHSVDVKKINQQPSKSQAKYDPNRWVPFISFKSLLEIVISLCFSAR